MKNINAKLQFVPSLPVAVSTVPMILTAGPEARLDRFDHTIATISAKRKIAAFIKYHEALGRFARPSVDQVSVSKMILKHARKRVAKNEELTSLAIMRSGNAILSHYVAPEFFPKVSKEFIGCVERLPKQPKGPRAIAA